MVELFSCVDSVDGLMGSSEVLSTNMFIGIFFSTIIGGPTFLIGDTVTHVVVVVVAVGVVSTAAVSSAKWGGGSYIEQLTVL